MLSSKTPVSALQELCTSRTWSPPSYAETGVLGPDHCRTFEVTVRLHNGIIAKGVGRQKKEAKHAAAKAALHIIQNSDCSGGCIPVTSSTADEALVNPQLDVGIAYAINELRDFCTSNHLPEPKYELTSDEGEPHRKTFTCHCSVFERHATGRAGSMQQARQIAAQNMLLLLKNNLKDILEDMSNNPVAPLSQKAKVEELEALDKEMMEKYKNLKKECRDVDLMSPGLRFSELQLAYKDQLLDLYQALMCTRCTRVSNPVQKLELIASVLNYTITTHTVVGKNKETIVFKVVGTNPPIYQAGHGFDRDKAEISAAKNAIEYLKLMAS